ncbi:MAG: glutamate formimidoyltransferase [Bacillota bacterium]
MLDKFIHAVPNFSEGRNKEIVEAVVDQVRNVEGVKLVAYFPDADFNRTVIELIGQPEPLFDALLNMAGKAIELIDMEKQRGNHPRIGAQDTIPIFPLRNITLDECKELAERIGQEIYARYNVPVYFTGENARRPERRDLGTIRKGQYEGLKEVAHTPERAPDIGPARLHPTAGAVIVSAGDNPLVAYNIILNTDNLEIAKTIAKAVRGPSGGFSTIRAVGLKFEERNQVVVSMNMFDHENTPIYRVFELVKFEALKYGVSIAGSEIVGVVPQRALLKSLEYYLKLEGFDPKQILENNLIGL